jgi:hypothetical protein
MRSPASLRTPQRVYAQEATANNFQRISSAPQELKAGRQADLSLACFNRAEIAVACAHASARLNACGPEDANMQASGLKCSTIDTGRQLVAIDSAYLL